LSTTPQTLQISAIQEAPGVMVVRCAGEIDLASHGELAEAIDWSYTSDLHTLRVDLSAVTFIDSRGIQCLLDAEERSRRLATRFEVVPSPTLRRIVSIVGVRFARPGGTGDGLRV
jgi:anti-sigma B factor antagonist